jgi:hypothetical protein
METAQGSDKRIGYSLLFGALGLFGGVALLATGFGDDQVVAGWAFAGAMLAATLLVTALHLYD